jgi:hypothetical protein
MIASKFSGSTRKAHRASARITRNPGNAAQRSARYDECIGSYKDSQHQMQFGYDFERSSDDLEFGGFQVFNVNTHIHQFLLAYDAT